MFEKLKLPTFSGKNLDYVDFKVKWMDQVHTAGYHELQKLTNLKDKVPKNAQDKLFDVKTLDVAWKILDDNYGNKELTVSLLKNKMKGIKPSSKEDHNRVLELKDQLSHLSRRMTAVGGQSLLDSDMDFIAAISKHLPDHLRYKWDAVSDDTTGSQWMSFTRFMEKEASIALRRRITETCLQGSENDIKGDKDDRKCHWCKRKGHLESDCLVKKHGKPKVINSAKVGTVNIHKKTKCPECKEVHTRKTRDGTANADRFQSCPVFKGKEVEDRVTMIKTHSACLNCTSWIH